MEPFPFCVLFGRGAGHVNLINQRAYTGIYVRMNVARRRDWIAEYSQSHQHAVNRACHTVGIPMIAASLPLLAVAAARKRGWKIPATLFGVGWALQFIGHAVEGKRPEFFRDPRFLFVGLRWWAAKVRGKA